MFSDLFINIKTTEDQILYLELIDTLIDSLYRLGDSGFDSTLRAQFPVEVAESIKKVITDSKLGREETLKKLRKEIANLRPINIELAFSPSKESIERIYSWLNSNCTPGFVIQVITNPRVIGGATITHNGKFFNGSIVENVTQFLDSRHEK